MHTATFAFVFPFVNLEMSGQCHTICLSGFDPRPTISCFIIRPIFFQQIETPTTKAFTRRRTMMRSTCQLILSLLVLRIECIPAQGSERSKISLFESLLESIPSSLLSVPSPSTVFAPTNEAGTEVIVGASAVSNRGFRELYNVASISGAAPEAGISTASLQPDDVTIRTAQIDYANLEGILIIKFKALL